MQYHIYVKLYRTIPSADDQTTEREVQNVMMEMDVRFPFESATLCRRIQNYLHLKLVLFKVHSVLK